MKDVDDNWRNRKKGKVDEDGKNESECSYGKMVEEEG